MIYATFVVVFWLFVNFSSKFRNLILLELFFSKNCYSVIRRIITSETSRKLIFCKIVCSFYIIFMNMVFMFIDENIHQKTMELRKLFFHLSKHKSTHVHDNSKTVWNTTMKFYNFIRRLISRNSICSAELWLNSWDLFVLVEQV